MDDDADVTGETDEFQVVEDADRRRFELRRGDELLAFASYRDGDGSAVIPHVETLEAHRGNGYASRLMDGVVVLLQQSDRTIVPLCPFAAAYMRDHPELSDLLA